ncbi:MAG: hypothetical protein KF893_07460, partial [Caldilineaceae bacterium]|nr:hypothetical protein [Caldilineaceae bacterium]
MASNSISFRLQLFKSTLPGMLFIIIGMSFLPFKQRTFSEGDFIPLLGMVFGFLYSLPFWVDSCSRWVVQSTGIVNSSMEQRRTPTRGLSRWTRNYYEIEGQSIWTN